MNKKAVQFARVMIMCVTSIYETKGIFISIMCCG